MLKFTHGYQGHAFRPRKHCKLNRLLEFQSSQNKADIERRENEINFLPSYFIY